MLRCAVTVVVTGSHDDPAFIPTGPGVRTFPHLLDADNLREAATITSRLEPDSSGRIPLPLLRIDTTCTPGKQRAIPFPESPRLLAGLIADAVRVGVAMGAVVAVEGSAPLPQRLRSDVAEHLRREGFDVTVEIPGWVPTNSTLERSS